MVLEPMHLEEINDNLTRIKGWDELNQDFIKKTFHFPDFKEALEFVNKIGIVAEAQNHYPKIILSHGQVIIKLFTVEAEGITYKDFELAKLIEEIFEEYTRNIKK
ncbi:4a-hydroxytetrahydrobiopterin dehydratase [Candidatus Woesearchaeota archaeon]|nr:4a-hydroxytetrahydrobiopterin dehydratase [Candidatus Woesearchaeota archaeon]